MAETHALIWLWGPKSTGKSGLVLHFLAQRNLTAHWCTLDRRDRDAHSLFRKLTHAAGSNATPFESHHRTDIASFTSAVCGDAWCRLGKPQVLVFDDSHLALPGGLLEEVLRAAVGTAGSTGRVIVISREPPACSLADLQLAHVLAVIHSVRPPRSGSFERVVPRSARETNAESLANDILQATLHAPHDERLSRWLAQGWKSVRADGDSSLGNGLCEALLLHAALISGGARAQALYEELRFSERTGSDTDGSLLLHALTALVQLQLGEARACRAQVESGLDAAAKAGCQRHTALLRGIGIVAALSKRELVLARAALAEFRACLQDADARTQAFVRILNGWLALFSQDVSLAQVHLHAAIELAQEQQVPIAEAVARLFLLESLVSVGELRAARGQLSRVRELCDQIGSTLVSAWLELSEARVACAEPQTRDGALSHLARAFDVMRRAGYHWLPVLAMEPAALARLFGLALSAGVEPEFVRGLIRAHELVALPPACADGEWPFPVRIFTLSRFTLLVEGEPVRFNSKAQRRPIELLKALLAFGGRDVPEERLMDALWPETDADASERSLSVTVHRLRRLLCVPNALERRGRALTLNPTRVWVDAWAFERALARAQDLRGDARSEQLVRALRYYQRPFLADETEPWATLPRERLRAKCVARLVELCDGLERQGHFEAAEALYQRLLDAEPLDERLYWRLMTLFARRNLVHEASAVYRRCVRALSAAGLGAPSPGLEASYRALVARAAEPKQAG
ncbi:MAG TPA: BTAD domain-containing putative transcriptional regulator [Polyangiaceae bacterium]|nr:BTAD domain-containing putative transcriptional regulator [Polyangiaceae bacterium]